MKFMGIDHDGLCSCKIRNSHDHGPLEEPTEEEMKQWGMDVQAFFKKRHLIGASDIAWSLQIMSMMSFGLPFTSATDFLIAFRQSSIIMIQYAAEIVLWMCLGIFTIRQFNKWKRTFHCKSCNGWRW